MDGVDATNAPSLARDIILDHYRNPRHAGLREPFDQQVRRVNPVCGDDVTVRVLVAGEQVLDVSYRVLGCAVCQASTSMMAEAVTGCTVAHAINAHEALVTLVHSGVVGRVVPATVEQEHVDVLGDATALRSVLRSPLRLTCALLAWEALREALDTARSPVDGGVHLA